MKLIRQAAMLTVVLFGLTSLPYVYAAWSTPSQLVYTGLMFDVPDHAQYWSWVTASRQSLLISNTMTPELNPPRFMNPMMWALARVQQAFNLSFPSLFQVWRAAAVVLFVPVLLLFMRTLVRERERRATALMIAICGAGLGWTLVLAKQVLHTPDVPWPHDLYTVEPNTFWALLSYPNILLAEALVLLTLLCSWLVYASGGWSLLAPAVIGAVALSVSHAYDLITVYAVLGVLGIVECLRLRQIPYRLVLVGVMVGAASAPVALYYQRLTSIDPLWRSILSQYSNAGVWTPPHAHLVILMGIPLVLAAFAIARHTEWTAERRFVAVWAVTSLFLIYLPVVYQIKLLSAWQFPLAVLAAHGWHERVLPLFARRMPRIIATACLSVAVAGTNVYLFAWRFVELRRHESPYYLQRDSIDALVWLAEHSTPADVVLAPIDVGQFVPNYGGTRAYLAHWAMTNRFFERRENVDRFFRHDTSDNWREQLLRAENVTMILRSQPAGASEPLYDLRQSDKFDLIFSRPGAQVFRVRRPTDRELRASASAP